MAFDVTALTAWNDEHSDRSELIMAPIVGARTFEFLDKYSGMTGEDVMLPTLESTAPAQAGAACGFTTSGTTTISQFTLTATPIKVQEQICLQDLETYFAKAWLPGNSKPDSVEIIDDIVNRKLANISRRLEQTLWQGNTAYTNDTWLQRFNGYVQRIDAGSPVSATASTLNATNAVNIFQQIIFDAIPASVPELLGMEVDVFCGYDAFGYLLNGLQDLNHFHHTIE